MGSAGFTGHIRTEHSSPNRFNFSEAYKRINSEQKNNLTSEIKKNKKNVSALVVGMIHFPGLGGVDP